MAAQRKKPEYRVRATKSHLEYVHRLRLSVETLLGGKCNRCGFDNRFALQIDHVNGGGRKEFAELAPHQLYRKILNDSNGYQLLCANCNWLKYIINAKRTISVRRLLAIDMFGGICTECGFDDERALQFDHINDDGYLNRKSNGESLDAPIKYKLILENQNRFKLLCANCHSIRHRCSK